MNYTTHSIQIKATCPVDGMTEDEYDCDVDVPTGYLVYAEAIMKAVDQATQFPITQEALTQKLADKLRSRVTTTGSHATGRVKTTVTREPHLVVTIRPEDV
jgi:hypothetical protein